MRTLPAYVLIKISALRAANQIQAFQAHQTLKKELILIQHSHPSSRGTSAAWPQSLQISPLQTKPICSHVLPLFWQMSLPRLFVTLSPLTLWAMACMCFSVSLSKVWVLQQGYLCAHPAYLGNYTRGWIGLALPQGKGQTPQLLLPA